MTVDVGWIQGRQALFEAVILSKAKDPMQACTTGDTARHFLQALSRKLRKAAGEISRHGILRLRRHSLLRAADFAQDDRRE
jgi:hypothetical protein